MNNGVNIVCECELIDWSGENGKYIHISTGEIYNHHKHGILDCQRKVKEGILNYGEYFNICKFIPGDPNSNFPNANKKVNISVKPSPTAEEGIPPIPKKLFKPYTI